MLWWVRSIGDEGCIERLSLAKMSLERHLWSDVNKHAIAATAKPFDAPNGNYDILVKWVRHTLY